MSVSILQVLFYGIQSNSKPIIKWEDNFDMPGIDYHSAKAYINNYKVADVVETLDKRHWRWYIFDCPEFGLEKFQKTHRKRDCAVKACKKYLQKSFDKYWITNNE